MSIDSARDHVDIWKARKMLMLQEERSSLNTACISFVQFLGEKERPNFSLSEAILNAAIASALAAVPGALFLTKTWKSATEIAKIITDEGKELAKLAVEKTYEAARDLGQKIDNRNTVQVQVNSTMSVFMDRYLRMALRPLHRAMNETLVVWETWRQILTGWDWKKDPYPIVREKLPWPDISNLEHKLALFCVAAEYYLIGAYVKSNVIVEKIISGFAGQSIRLKVHGLNKTQLDIIYYIWSCKRNASGYLT